MRRGKPAGAKNWTAAEESYLEEKWGEISIGTIAKNLGRSRDAVVCRARRMELGPHLMGDQRVSFNQLFVAIYGKTMGNYTANVLLRYGLPIHWHVVNRSRFRVVDLEEFWIWAEQHKDVLDFSRFETGTLGPEPEWARRKRRLDKRKKHEFGAHNDAWTPQQDARLRRMLEARKYTYTEIAVAVSHGEGAVKRRIYDLGINLKPVRAKNKPWTDEDVERLLQLREQGMPWELMSKELGRSALSIRGKYERMLNPEYMKRYNRGKSKEYEYCGIRSASVDEIREIEKLKKADLNDVEIREEMVG